MILKTLFKILCVVLPLIIIVRTDVPLVKAIMNGGAKLKEEIIPIFKSLFAALFVFMLPFLTQYLFTELIDPGSSEIFTCFDSATPEKIQSLREQEKEQRLAEKKKRDEELKAGTDKETEKWKQETEKKQQQIQKEKERERAQQEARQQAASGGGGSTGGSSGGEGSTHSSVSPGTSTIIIGDSRTVGMCASITGDWTNCQYANGGKGNGDDYYIAQGSMGYSWFNSTAVPAVNNIIKSNPGTRYNIISLMGVNYLLSDIDKYIVKYNELANGDWKNQNIILVSVTPVDEGVEAQHGYSTKNANIETFNAKLKSGTSGVSNIGYCDVYSQIKGNFGTGDGLHYSGETYKNIYSLMKACI